VENTYFSRFYDLHERLKLVRHGFSFEQFSRIALASWTTAKNPQRHTAERKLMALEPTACLASPLPHVDGRA